MEALLKYKTVRESRFYRKIRSNKVQCTLCERMCVLEEGEKGFCKTRVNINGKIYTLVYGDLSAIESRPIEIKPFFHYWPGSTATTISTWSCNFNCPWCQNYHLSRTPPDPSKSIFRSPEDVLSYAVDWGDEGICVSFQEPTLLTDFALDLFPMARERGFYCCYVSNGYMSLEALEALVESGLTGLKIDIKGGKDDYLRYCQDIDVEIPWRNAKVAKSMGIHVEIVNLIVTGVNDNESVIREIIDRHLKDLGPEVPIHFTRYYPAYRFKNPPTKLEVLEKAYKLAKKEGVLYPYIGNVPGHPYENTYCPNCGELLIKRFSYRVIKFNISRENRCPRCGFEINLTGHYIRKIS
ncbi:AmmeMemoRadiSam system radical SAM enzyme [Candidatus Geothermarchaeota archaeon]|nr:MAG: AmmeMemoRadiSam system radical SAM enzyme [Candidatus Geothermarchaeota archaeon]